MSETGGISLVDPHMESWQAPFENELDGVFRDELQWVVKRPNCAACDYKRHEPSLVKLEACTHRADICRGCVSKWISERVFHVSCWERVECPSEDCDVVFSYDEILKYGTKDTFAKYDILGLQHSLRELPGYRACMRPGCLSGQIHSSTDEENIWTCEVCKFKVCTGHNAEFHHGQTCADYDSVQRQQTREDVASVEWIERNAKRCPVPGCSIPIEKRDGCDHMTCKSCGFEFCWVCLVPYETISGIRIVGNAAHDRSCPHYRPIVALVSDDSDEDEETFNC